jgi:TonB family protein
MFEKLVVSTSQRRRGRTTKFFLGTVVIYLSAVASAFALSIVLASPRLANGDLLFCKLPPAPSPRRTSDVVDHQTSGGAPRQNLSNFRSLEYIIEHPQPGGSQNAVPVGTAVGKGDGPSGGDPNALPGPVGVIGGEPRSIEPAPKPPDPPKPPARTAADDGRPMRVTSVVLQGKAIERRTPIYPPLAKQIRLQGNVSVEVIISPDGRVEGARVVSGHPMLATFAREAALGWRFEPTFLNGVAVRVTGVITFVFKLNE